jgi:hypothetical protein
MHSVYCRDLEALVDWSLKQTAQTRGALSTGTVRCTALLVLSCRQQTWARTCPLVAGGAACLAQRMGRPLRKRAVAHPSGRARRASQQLLVTVVGCLP